MNSARNRTAEFFAVVDSVQSRKGPVIAPQRPRTNVTSRTEFTRLAAAIGHGLKGTAAKLEKLTKLVKKKSLFDDRPVEIQELTYIVKQEMSSLNQQIAQLQQLSQAQRAAHPSKQAEDHTSNVVISLQSKLATTSNSFKDILEIRTQNMKAQKDRREQFSANVPLSTKPLAGTSALYRREKGRDDPGTPKNDYVAIDFGSQSQEMQVLQQDTYHESRFSEIQSIESTIAQLGGIFQQLATLIAQQGEQVQRIDTNIDEVEHNVSEGQKQLLKYLASISSNRWLMVKIFVVLIIFFIVFVVFIA